MKLSLKVSIMQRVILSSTTACSWIIACALGSILHRIPGNADQVDAVSVAAAVRQVMSQMGTSQRNGLSIPESTHCIPVDLLVSEGWPSV